MAKRHREETAAVADIGELPPPANPARREACRLDLHRFLQDYFPHSSGKRPFSPDHIRVIQRIQQALSVGGNFAQAMFRGSAKSTIAENAAIWATIFGHRKFVPIIGANAGAAERSIESVKIELETNDLLAEDFPEVCVAVRALEGRPQRCASQCHTALVPCIDCQGTGKLAAGKARKKKATPRCPKCRGHGRIKSTTRTHIEWTAKRIVFPSIAGSAASGAIITAHGITAASRGLRYKRADGSQQRPDAVLIDDPQTDESAQSPRQVVKRLDLITKNLLKLGGHDKQIAAVLTGTVIEPDDVVDQLLDAKKYPSWQGERIQMVRKWADAHEPMWLGEYARLRNTYDAETPGSQKLAHQAANEYYAANRAAMDAGAVVCWEHCFDRDREISAIQHAYNLLIDDGPDVFASECQNQPVARAAEEGHLESRQVAAKSVKLPRGIVPAWATHLTAFIDVQEKALYGGVVGWGDGFRGQVLHYGTFPDQKKAYFGYREVKVTLARLFPNHGKESMLRAGLEAFCELLLGSAYKREDGAEMRVGAAMIDAGDGDHFDIVNEFCRRSRFAPILKPSKGRYVGASSAPWEMYPKRAGEVMGHHWLVAPVPKSPAVRLCHFDTNYWKNFIHTGFKEPLGSRRGLEIFDGDHRMLADHVTSEFGVKTEGRGRVVTEFKLRPGRDNHLLDVIVGCAVCASMVGIKLDIGTKPRRTTRKRGGAVSYL
jgi:hypothetical protein